MIPTLNDPAAYVQPRSRLEWGVQSLLLPLVLVLAWELSVRYGLVPSTLIASPSRVAVRFVQMLLDLRLFRHSAISLARLLAGFSLGCAVGVALGAWVGFSRLVARVVEPTLLTLIPIPPIAWIPLLIILFGIGEASKVALIAIGSFCTLFIHTAYGVRSADKAYVEVAHVLEKNDQFVLRHVLLPSALPGILSSMRVAMALSWTLLMASEIIASAQGLGWLIWDSRNFSRADDMIVGMVAVGILGKLTDSGLVSAERRLTGWRKTFAST